MSMEHLGIYPKIDMRATGSKIKEKVREKGLTTKELMGYFGFLHSKSIFAWYRGSSLPSLDNFLALSVLLDVTINDLLVFHPQEE